MDKEVLEVVMKRHQRNNNIARILNVRQEPAVAKGENYLSTILRLRVEAVLGNGRKAKKNFILKALPSAEGLANFVKQDGIFKYEADVYRNVLEKMEELMDEFEDLDNVLWCKLLHYQADESLLLEDLQQKGYRVVKRQDCLDLEHGILVVRGLARFHAMAKVLEERGVISKGGFRPCPYMTNPGDAQRFFHNGLLSVSKAILTYWGPSRKELGERLLVPVDELLQKLLKVGKVEESKFCGINHGDCWTSNFLFKYDFRNVPYSVRFVDYQWVHYNSYCLDLSHLIYLSLQPAVRRNHYDELMSNYLDSFNMTLDRYGYNGMKPSLSELNAEMDRVILFALCLFIIRFGPVTTRRNDALDMDKVVESGGIEGVNFKIYDDPVLIEAMVPEIIRFLDILKR